MLAKKSLYYENVGLTKVVKVLSALYEQKLVYQNPVKKQNYVNDSGPTKVGKCAYIQTKHTIVGPVKHTIVGLNCLNEIGQKTKLSKLYTFFVFVRCKRFCASLYL